MNSKSLRCALLLFGVLSVSGSSALRAQTHSDIVRGRVTTDSGVAIASADVIATMAPDRLSQATKTDGDGKYSIAFEHGTGDYLVHFSAPGRETYRKRVTRTRTDSVFIVDAKLARAQAQQLAAVSVQAKKQKPDREKGGYTTETGAAERLADGVNGAVPPDQAGDIAAIAGTIPGVAVTPGGVSVGGLSSAQNSTTLNGMAFAGADVPRDASTRVRVSSSTYDPARGWFSGLQQDVELTQGDLFAFRRAHLTVDAPALQYTDPIAAGLGQRFTNLQGSVGGDGPLNGDKFVYNYGAQAERRISDAVSLAGASPDLLQHAGVAADSAARLFNLLSSAGVPLNIGGLPSSRISQSASFIGRIDHAPYDWKNYEPARQTWGVQAYGKIANSDAVGVGPTATLTHTGQTSDAIGMVQALFSTYFHRDYLTEATSALSFTRHQSDPYLNLPEGRVLVASSFPDGTGGVTSLAFGGNSLLDNTRQWTWETTSVTQFFAPGHTAHRVKLNTDLRFDGVRQEANTNAFGTFSYNSLADLAANSPTSFTRTLNSPTRTGGEWNGFVSVGDLWRKSQTFQLLYGARLEGNHFTEVPAYNPLVQSTFGAQTDRAPNTVHLSPRLGFTWVRQRNANYGMRANQLGTFFMAPTSYVRGGIGEFRSLIPSTLLTAASIATGLPSGLQSLTCVGPAAPVPAWSDYAANVATIPTQCIGSAPTAMFADAAPSVQLFDPSYTAPRSWRANLGYSSSYRNLIYTLEGLYSLNLNQPGRTDLNFSNTARFATSNEGRPVFVGQSSVVPTTGALSTVDARRSALFGHVLDNMSGLRSMSRQMTLTVTPTELSNWLLSGAYTLADTRASASGFDGSTFGSPIARGWARGDLDVRHQLLLQGGYSKKRVALTFFGRLQSGLPFTPLIGSDVNGDGLANDRAFIFDPSNPANASLADATHSLLASAHGNVRDCITRQINRAAGRNSCEGPWTASLNAQLSFPVKIPGSARTASVALAFVNPLGGLDQLLHGSNNLRGWGTQSFPDQTLYNVRGFDPATNAFKYEVNPRFGSTNPSLTTLRAPFRVTLDVRFDLSTPLGQQQLDRWLKPGRAGRPGPRLTAAELKRRYQRNVPDPYSGLLRETDSLLITREQADAIEKVQTVYKQQIDSLWTSLADYLAGLGDNFNTAAALKRQEQTIDDAWEISRLSVQRTLPSILSPVQLKLLPWPVGMLYTSKEKVKMRMFFSGNS